MIKKNEFERKFLCYTLPDLSYIKVEYLTQYYLTNNRRLRVISDVFTKEIKKHELITKTKVGEGHNVEVTSDFDTPTLNTIYREVASSKLPLVISKIRYTHVDSNTGHIFEFDVFDKLNNLVVLEIETPLKNTELSINKHIGSYIISEVTEKEEFSNINLAIKIQEICLRES